MFWGVLRSVCVAGPVAGACSSLEPLRSTREMGRNGMKGIEPKNSGFKQKRGFLWKAAPRRVAPGMVNPKLLSLPFLGSGDIFILRTLRNTTLGARFCCTQGFLQRFRFPPVISWKNNHLRTVLIAEQPAITVILISISI